MATHDISEGSKARVEGTAQQREPGALLGKIWITDDFDALPDDMEEAFGVR